MFALLGFNLMFLQSFFTILHSSLLEGDKYCAIICWKDLFLAFTKCHRQEIALSASRDFGHLKSAEMLQNNGIFEVRMNTLSISLW